MRIKAIVLAIILTPGAHNVYALSLDSEQNADQDSVTEQKTQPAERDTKDTNNEKPSPGFTPSERIEADSAVSTTMKRCSESSKR